MLQTPSRRQHRHASDGPRHPRSLAHEHPTPVALHPQRLRRGPRLGRRSHGLGRSLAARRQPAQLRVGREFRRSFGPAGATRGQGGSEADVRLPRRAPAIPVRLLDRSADSRTVRRGLVLAVRRPLRTAGGTLAGGRCRTLVQAPARRRRLGRLEAAHRARRRRRRLECVAAPRGEATAAAAPRDAPADRAAPQGRRAAAGGRVPARADGQDGRAAVGFRGRAGHDGTRRQPVLRLRTGGRESPVDQSRRRQGVRAARAHGRGLLRRAGACVATAGHPGPRGVIRRSVRVSAGPGRLVSCKAVAGSRRQRTDVALSLCRQQAGPGVARRPQRPIRVPCFSVQLPAGADGGGLPAEPRRRHPLGAVGVLVATPGAEGRAVCLGPARDGGRRRGSRAGVRRRRRRDGPRF